jgi:hypothetical protein
VNFSWIKQDPDINPLRDNPEFQAVMAELSSQAATG